MPKPTSPIIKPAQDLFTALLALIYNDGAQCVIHDIDSIISALKPIQNYAHDQLHNPKPKEQTNA